MEMDDKAHASAAAVGRRRLDVCMVEDDGDGFNDGVKNALKTGISIGRCHNSDE
jgi:hypothetical protein